MRINIVYPPVPEGVSRMLSEVSNKRGLHRSMSYDLSVMIAAHVRKASRTRHKTANRLGARPTGHIEAAARSVMPETKGNEIAVTIDSPGFKRVDGPLTIRARNTPNLTIPVHAVAYGRRVRTLRRLLGTPIFRPLAKGGKKGMGPYQNYLAGQVGGTFRILYALKPQVILPHDPGLLPTSPAIERRLLGAMRTYIRSKVNLEA